MSNGKRNKTSLFIKIYLGVTIAALAVIAVIWGVLWSFLKAYEASQPQYKIEQVVHLLWKPAGSLQKSIQMLNYM